MTSALKDMTAGMAPMMEPAALSRKARRFAHPLALEPFAEPGCARRVIMRMKQCRAGVVASILLVLGAAGSADAAAQRPGELPNPFGSFDAFRLPNGLKVWYGYLPGATMTSMAIVVPAGWDQDQPQREGTAHLLEHVLLSDRTGRSESELVRELALRGGTHNGVTTPDRTYYPLHISTDQAAYGLQWLHDVIAPRPIPTALVDANREPVAIEIGAGPRQSFERLAHAYLFHPSLRPAGFWLREFGVVTAQERYHDPYTSLASLSAHDLTTFYESFYTTPEMLLVVVTGAPRQVLQPVIDSTFGLLPWRPAPERSGLGPLPRRDSQRYAWTLGRSTRFRLMYRIPDLSSRDHLRLVFIEDMLRLRFMERLRRGSDKFVYSIHATTETRGAAAYLAVVARIDPRQEEHARSIIQEELLRIGSATDDTAAFYADRDALGHRLRVQNAAPATLVAWATDRFYRPDLHAEFPDLGEYYATVGPDSIAAFVQRLLIPENRIFHLTRAAPAPAGVFVLLLGLAATAAVALYRRIAYRRADMSGIRYIARLRHPLIVRLIGRSLAFAGVLLIARVGYAAAELVAERWIFAVDSPLLHVTLLTVTVFVAAFCTIAAAGLVPRKVLVFQNEIRIKSLTYRACIIPAGHVTNVWTVGRHSAATQHSGAAGSWRSPAHPRLHLLQRARLAGSTAVILGLADGSLRVLPVTNPGSLAAVLAVVTDRRENADADRQGTGVSPERNEPGPTHAHTPVGETA
jgi:predicted Zn-dependent peptidase